MAKLQPRARDHTVRNILLATLLSLSLGFGGVWLYVEREQRLAAEVHFLTLPRVAISRDGHSMAATVAIRTNGKAAEWAAGHKRALEEAVKISLMAADPVASRGPEGIAQLQREIVEASNRMLNTDSVQEALVTDFLVAEGDY